MDSPRGVSVPHLDSSWKYLGTILVPLPGSLVDHSDILAGSEHFDIDFSEDAYIIRGKDTGYGDISLVCFKSTGLFHGKLCAMHAGRMFLSWKFVRKSRDCI